MKRMLWVGDAGCPSGFAVATHNILATLSKEYEVTVLGLNYRGDPHTYPYKIFAAAPGGDSFGAGRFLWMFGIVKPDVVVIQNDGWNIPLYMSRLHKKKPNGEYLHPELASVPVIAIVAVDGKNFQGEWLEGVELAIFWTYFALSEARKGGYQGPATVIPLGVDLTTYYPEDKTAARIKHIEPLKDAFIVGNVNRNQLRKRWDLTIRYFARWVKQLDMSVSEDELREAPMKIRDAYLFFHVAPTGDTGIDPWKLAEYYGVRQRLALRSPDTWYGISEDEMRETYNCFDVLVTTTQGEGFGLPTIEGMACGVPIIAPRWSALEEICEDAGLLVPCTSTAVGFPYVGVIGGVVDENLFVESLNMVYQDHDLRAKMGMDSLHRAEEQRFDWAFIGKQYLGAIDQTLHHVAELNAPEVEAPVQV